VAAHGALTPLGRALVEADGAALAEAARRLVDTASDAAIFQADLTALVPGTPGAALAALLGSAAERESRGTASTWRFSAGSVRRALDAGYTAGQLAEELAAVAVGGKLPQPLTYLLTDVARQHGRLRVRNVACVLHTEDPALLAELLAAKALAGLRLAALAPTVLSSAKPAAETLAALRSAGYAPVGEDAGGQPLIERTVSRRAAQVEHAPVPRRGVRPEDPPADPAELATLLLATSRRMDTALFDEPADLDPPARKKRAANERDGTLELVGRYARQLDDDEQRLLAYAIDTGSPVRIHYVDGDGQPSVRVIEPIEFTGNSVDAWCRLRDDERMFVLSRIGAVSPA
jgi:hypothetical protein